jgi:hypothetical protein
MGRTTFITAQISLMAMAILFGCNPTPEPVSNDSTSVPSETTPAPSAMPCITAEHITLLQTMVGHNLSALDVAFSARGEFLVSSGRDMINKIVGRQAWV